MVRINLIKPKLLADQHLIAEFDEILMLVGYIRKNIHRLDDIWIPDEYCLGTGHIRFFVNKLKYIHKRHIAITKEMQRRGFKPKVTLDLSDLPAKLYNNFRPQDKDFSLIIHRIALKLFKKPDYYKYYGKNIENITKFVSNMRLEYAKNNGICECC